MRLRDRLADRPPVWCHSGGMIHHDAFYNGDEQSGVLLRDARPDQLATFVCFTLDDEETYRAEQITDLGADPTEWTSFRFAETTSGDVTLGTRDDRGVNVGGVLLEPDAVPSYLGWRILTELAGVGGERARFHQFDEHGDPRVREAEYVSRGLEAIDVPGLALEAAYRFDLLLDGAPYTSHWWDGRHVVASDWTGGAMSVRTPDLEAALARCPVRVAERARSWLAGRTPSA